MSSTRTLALLAAMLLPAAAQEQGKIDSSGKFVPTSPGTAKEGSKEELLVQPDGADRYRLGLITFDKARREVTIPATVNLDQGLVEYALVAESGKVHEALFTTKANPLAIHLACLLLGMPKEEEGKSSACDVKVHVTWDSNGPPALHELANLVATSETPDAPVDAKPLSGGPWRYVSSTTGPKGFAAATEGSIISLIEDPAALVVNPRESAHRDDIHVANRKLLPPKGSPVRIILTLPAKP